MKSISFVIISLLFFHLAYAQNTQKSANALSVHPIQGREPYLTSDFDITRYFIVKYGDKIVSHQVNDQNILDVDPYMMLSNFKIELSVPSTEIAELNRYYRDDDGDAFSHIRPHQFELEWFLGNESFSLTDTDFCKIGNTVLSNKTVSLKVIMSGMSVYSEYGMPIAKNYDNTFTKQYDVQINGLCSLRPGSMDWWSGSNGRKISSGQSYDQNNVNDSTKWLNGGGGHLADFIPDVGFKPSTQLASDVDTFPSVVFKGAYFAINGFCHGCTSWEIIPAHDSIKINQVAGEVYFDEIQESNPPLGQFELVGKRGSENVVMHKFHIKRALKFFLFPQRDNMRYQETVEEPIDQCTDPYKRVNFNHYMLMDKELDWFQSFINFGTSNYDYIQWRSTRSAQGATLIGNWGMISKEAYSKYFHVNKVGDNLYDAGSMQNPAVIKSYAAWDDRGRFIRRYPLMIPQTGSIGSYFDQMKNNNWYYNNSRLLGEHLCMLER